MIKEDITTAKKRNFDKLLEDYANTICKVIQKYQKNELGCAYPVQFKKELLRHLGVSADLSRKIISGNVTGISTMMHTLDVMKNILSLYDPGFLAEDRNALLKRKNYFFKNYVANVDMSKPIIQRARKPENSKGGAE